MIRTLLVDDEPLARGRLRRFLEEVEGFTIVGEAGDGFAALEAIAAHRPDLVFLDVQMPEMDGLEVARSLDPETRPALVFVTAFDAYAVPAFDLNAVDYLLKPFDRDRFRQALERIRQRLASRTAQQPLEALLQTPPPAGRYPKRLAFLTDGRYTIVGLSEIDLIEAAGNYFVLHLGKTTHIVRGTLSGLEGQLDPERFARVNRSVILSLDQVREVRPHARGDQVVVLRDGTEQLLTRRHRDLFFQRLGHRVE